MKKHCRGIVLVSAWLVITCSVASADTLKRASFIPQWVPQAQFAGYYIGLHKGIYEKYGIDLTIITGGPDNPSSDILADKSADFASFWLSAGIQMRAGGTGILNIAQIMQRSALMFVAKKASGIERPADMNGRRVGVWGQVFQVQPRAFFEKYDLRVQSVPQSFSVNLFLRDGVDVASVMWYNEYHTILNCGIDPDELTSFFFHEHGLNFPEDGIYVLEETYKEDPALCTAFVLASIEGWQYAFDHPDEALAVTMHNLEKAHVPTTLVHQKWMLARMQDLILVAGGDGRAMGRLRSEDYQRVGSSLKAMGLIEAVPDFTSFHKEVIHEDEH